MRIVVAAFFVFLSGIGPVGSGPNLAVDPWGDFKQPSANGAVARFRKTLVEAHRNLKHELEAAQASAVEKKDLDESLKLRTAVELLEQGYAPTHDANLSERLKGTIWHFNSGSNRFRSTTHVIAFTDKEYKRYDLGGGNERGPAPYRVMSPYSIGFGNVECFFTSDFRHGVYVSVDGVTPLLRQK